MRERPILFSAPMVRAILEGRKSMTRRAVKAKHIPFLEDLLGGFLDGKWNQRPMPYGQPGDRLWVRETFTAFRAHTDEETRHNLKVLREGLCDPNFNYSLLRGPSGDTKVLYRADFGSWANDVDSDLGPWRPSIFMPRWASRITLEITGVRVERLQEIDRDDIASEGVEIKCKSDEGYLESFADLWDSINGKTYPWESNPWVFVISFRKID